MSKQAMIIYGGWAGHEPKEGSEFWAKELKDAGFEVTLTDELDALLDHEKVKAQDLLILNRTMDQMSGDQLKGVEAGIEAGVGIGGFHGGAGDAFRGNIGWQFIIGGQFLAHPDGVKDYRVHITQHNHEITAGLSDFDYHSEQYYMLVDPNVNVLAETVFHPESAPWMAGYRMPVVWTKMHNRSRVFYCALGHKAHEFETEPCRKIIRRGFQWAARG